MPYYSEDLINEIRDKNDIVDVVGEYVQLKKSGANYFGLCPFHSEKTGSFSVSPSKQIYKCFGCGKGGNVFNFIMSINNISFPEAVEELAARAGVELPERETTPEERKQENLRSRLYEINREAAIYFYKLLRTPHGAKALQYLKNRGITDETIYNFGLGYSDVYRDDLYRYLRQKGYSDDLILESKLAVQDERGIHDKFWNRVMYPIRNQNGKVIAFGGRVMGDGKPKYINSDDTMIFSKRYNLYGLDRARRSRRNGLILCEGYMDVITMHQAGFDNAVASLGTSYTREQARILKKYTDMVYLAYDDDLAGQNAAMKAVDLCDGEELRSRVIHMSPHKDPDEFIKAEGAQAFEKRIDGSESSLMFRISSRESEFRMDDAQDRTRFQKVMFGVLATVTEPFERENYIQECARRYNMSVDTITRGVNTIGMERLDQEKQREQQSQDRETRRKQERKVRNAGTLLEERLISSLVDYPGCIPQCMKYVSPEDMEDPVMSKLLTQIYEESRSGDGIDRHRIMDQWADSSDYDRVCSIVTEPTVFEGSAEIQEEHGDDREWISGAIAQTIEKVAVAGMERRKNALIQSGGDEGTIMKLAMEVNQLKQHRVKIEI